MAPGRKGPKRPSTRREPQVHEAPLTEYEKLRMNKIMQNNQRFRSLGLGHASAIMKSTRANPTAARRQESGSLYEPGEEDDIEQGVVDKAMQEPELNRSLEQNISIHVGSSKRVMALHEEDQPARITRQRTRELSTVHEGCNVTTTDPQGGSTEDALLPANVSNGAQDKSKRHVGRGLDRLSRGLSSKIPIHIAEGNLRPEAPLQAAKLASEAGIILRDNIPVLPHWKDYKKDDSLVEDYIGKIANNFTMDTNAKPVKDACTDLLKRGQRQLRYKLKKEFFNDVPANKVPTTSPVPNMTDAHWKALVDMWSSAKHKEKCLKNKDSRGLVRYPQKTGSRCFVAQCYVAKQTKYKDSPPTAIDLFKDTHCGRKTGFAENTLNAIARMEAIIAEPPKDGQDPKTPAEAVAQVLPRSHFLENIGMGDATVKKRANAAAVNEHVQELESELLAKNQESAELRLKLDLLEKKTQEQEEAARKQGGEIERISGFLRSCTSLFGSGSAPSLGPQ